MGQFFRGLMNYKVIINDEINESEVPELRRKVGWGPREYDEHEEFYRKCGFDIGLSGTVIY